ncbi:hypothetical protein [Roseibium aquae]|uniref:hypothetical protein n=1 Tax=Roseibium aquae TaxID=1323746 RepID=UPI00123CE35E|nr:hypothetical protein [Roseibium aquae]
MYAGPQACEKPSPNVTLAVFDDFRRFLPVQGEPEPVKAGGKNAAADRQNGPRGEQNLTLTCCFQFKMR